MIWCIKLFKGHLITGDSQGELCIWDEKFGTMVKSFKNLQSDILTLAVSESFNSVYASGVDSRVLNVMFLEDTEDWVVSSIYRAQSHDVKVLLLLSPSQLLSAGVTTDLCLYRLYDGRFKD